MDDSRPATPHQALPRRLFARSGGRTVAVDVLASERVVVEGEPAAFAVTPIGPGAYVVSDGARQWRVWVDGPPEARQVFLDGTVYDVGVSDAAEPSRPGRRLGESALVAPMPATVIEVLVERDQPVHAGDLLLKLEAMKMELPVRAPRDGIVRAVNCEVGDLVRPGTILVDLT